MSLSDQEPQPKRAYPSFEAAQVVPLDAVDRMSLLVVGGKAANLGELIKAGFPVPAGFCVTTAAYALHSELAGLEPILEELAAHMQPDPTRQLALAAAAREALLQAPLPTEVIKAVTAAYHRFFGGEPVPVAVRSSATAEDLPAASFAGQQDTFLNRIGIESVLEAMKRCFASLWTERATSYRSSLGIDPRIVHIAVVVQRMVAAQVAGVLFTANPLTGKRRESAIEASPGLGEAVVSGATNPDHFILRTKSGELIERRLGDKRMIIQAAPEGGTRQVEVDRPAHEACLSDAQVRSLAALGSRVEEQFGVPQDIEWAIDPSGQIFLLQARPITTLFPLPAGTPISDEILRVYLSFTVQQGTYSPYTPMGISATRLLASSIVTLLGFPPSLPRPGPRFVTEAALRIFFDVTAALRSSFGRRLLMQAMRQAEVHAVAIFQQLESDQRLSLLPTPRWPLMRTVVLLLVRTRLPWSLLLALLSPRSADSRLQRLVRMLHAAGMVAKDAPTSAYMAAVQQLCMDTMLPMLRAASPAMLGALLNTALARRLLGDLATEDELQVVLRAAPSNPITEMTRALWALAQGISADPKSLRLVQNAPAVQLAEDYRNCILPPPLQHGLASFMATYGHRSVAELDLGVPRWSEDPAPVLGILASFLEIRDPARLPDAQFQHAVEEAETMSAELTRRATHANRVRGLLVGFCLSRARAFAGLREMPRFCLSLLLARARSLLWFVGEDLVKAGRLEHSDDIFFLTQPEALDALAGADLRPLVSERRALYEQELARRHVPLVLLSDGTEPPLQQHIDAAAFDTMQGAPASPGVVTAPARVVLDPRDARLESGEILVAPSTDPGWTPLFLRAAGLVMEVGGAMAHGALVAREYGIPAVVGVPHATERISTGMRITVDGTSGTVIIEDDREEGEAPAAGDASF
jgi:rifampicin phosphotransferase